MTSTWRRSESEGAAHSGDIFNMLTSQRNSLMKEKWPSCNDLLTPSRHQLASIVCFRVMTIRIHYAVCEAQRRWAFFSFCKGGISACGWWKGPISVTELLSYRWYKVTSLKLHPTFQNPKRTFGFLLNQSTKCIDNRMKWRKKKWKKNGIGLLQLLHSLLFLLVCLLNFICMRVWPKSNDVRLLTTTAATTYTQFVVVPCTCTHMVWNCPHTIQYLQRKIKQCLILNWLHLPPHRLVKSDRDLLHFMIHQSQWILKTMPCKKVALVSWDWRFPSFFLTFEPCNLPIVLTLRCPKGWNALSQRYTLAMSMVEPLKPKLLL